MVPVHILDAAIRCGMSLLRAEDDVMLSRARRMAKRRRTEAACDRCKKQKTKCSDYRPCLRCKSSGGIKICTSSSLDPSGRISVEESYFHPKQANSIDDFRLGNEESTHFCVAGAHSLIAEGPYQIPNQKQLADISFSYEASAVQMHSKLPSWCEV